MGRDDVGRRIRRDLRHHAIRRRRVRKLRGDDDIWDELAEELERVLATTYTEGKPYRRRWLGLLNGALVGVIAAIGMFFYAHAQNTPAAATMKSARVVLPAAPTRAAAMKTARSRRAR